MVEKVSIDNMSVEKTSQCHGQFVTNLFIALCNEETIIDKEAGNGQFIKSDIWQQVVQTC